MISFISGSDNHSVNVISTNLYAKSIRIVVLNFWLVHFSDKIIKCQISAAVVSYSVAVYIAGHLTRGIFPTICKFSTVCMCTILSRENSS